MIFWCEYDMIWMGDSTTRLVGKVYTHFPDEFMLENMQKVQFIAE